MAIPNMPPRFYHTRPALGWGGGVGRVTYIGHPTLFLSEMFLEISISVCLPQAIQNQIFCFGTPFITVVIQFTHLDRRTTESVTRMLL